MKLTYFPQVFFTHIQNSSANHSFFLNCKNFKEMLSLVPWIYINFYTRWTEKCICPFLFYLNKRPRQQQELISHYLETSYHQTSVPIQRWFCIVENTTGLLFSPEGIFEAFKSFVIQSVISISLNYLHLPSFFFHLCVWHFTDE